jgi:hypothetical protein
MNVAPERNAAELNAAEPEQPVRSGTDEVESPFPVLGGAGERPHPGRTAGVVLGAVGMMLVLLVGLGALVATAVDLLTWGLKAS